MGRDKKIKSGRESRFAGGAGWRRGWSVFLAAVVFFIAISSQAAEIYINRTGVIQLDLNNLTSGASNNLRNDPVPDFNFYMSRWDAQNPIQWTHSWSLTNASYGAHPLDGDEVYVNMITAELFPVIWDIDYPVSDEHDVLFWDSVPYAGPGGAAFDMTGNPTASNLGYVRGNNNYWGAKRITLDPVLLDPAGDTEYFWLQVDEDPGGINWLSSIDYSDLAIIFNWGDLTINKTITGVTGFNPPRVGYTTTYTVKIDIANNTTTSGGGPMHDVVVTDNFPPGSVVITPPALGSYTMDGAGNLSWTVGKLEDGALNAPPAAGSSDFMVVSVQVTPVMAQVGSPVMLNAGAAINGKQVPQNPGDGSELLYPFNFYTNPANDTSDISAPVVTASAVAANTGTITTTASIIPGAAISISVTDADLNSNSAAVESVTVAVANQTTGETESVVCSETGANTGIFAASLPTVFGFAAGANNTGSMNVKASDVVRATYSDLVNAVGIAATATDDTAVIGGDTATIVSTTPIFPGDSATTTVDDSDLNANPAVAETFQLIVRNSRTAEAETVTFTETGANTGVFDAVLPTAFGVAAGANNSGAMNCVSGDTLQVQYADLLTAIGNTATVSAATDVIGGSDGSLNMTAAIIPGENISATIVDNDLNTSPATAQTVSLVMTNGRTGEAETVVLTETGANTGLFTGAIPTVFGTLAGANNNGTMTVRAGDSISAQYFDARTGLGGTATVSDSTTVNGGADGSVSATPSIIPGASSTFTLIDSDLNTNTLVAETYIYQVKNPFTGETENTQFAETGPDTGIFVGAAATAFGLAGGANNTGSFSTRAGWSLVFTYNDVLTAIGGTAVEVAATQIIGGATAVLSCAAATPAGSPADCSLSDADLNTDAATVETLSIGAVNNITGEIENITFTETAAGSGVFAVSITTVFRTGAGPDNDGEFFTLGGHTITLTYNDALTVNGGPAVMTSTAALTDDVNFITIDGPSGSFNNSVLTIFGVTDPYSAVSMLDPVTAAPLAATADVNGNYSFANIKFPEGTLTFTVTSIDLAGNSASAASTVLVDTTNFIVASAPAPGSVINTKTNDVSGTTDPGATVTVTEPSSGALLTVTADATGIFIFEDAIFNSGANVLNFTSVDALNNTATTTATITIDLSIVLSISSITAGSIYNTASHRVAGTTDPGATVRGVNPASGLTVTTLADAAGAYDFGLFVFPDGANTVTVTATDPPGNVAVASVSFFQDTINGNAISNTGTYRTTTVDIAGTTDPFAAVSMTHPLNGQAYSATADTAGNYSFPAVPFPDGSYTVTTTSVDPNGNTAVDSAGFIVDATIFLTILDPSNNAVVTTGTANVSGSTDPGSTVYIYSPANDVKITAVADAAGNFTLSGAVLLDGKNYIEAISTDTAGNTAVDTLTIYYFQTINISITSPRDGSVVQTGLQDVIGKTDPLVSVHLFHPVTGAQIATVADAQGNYSFSALPFPEGLNTVTVYATTVDILGNQLFANTSSDFLVADTGVDATLEASVRTVVGEYIFVKVSDHENYRSATSRDTVQISVTNASTGDSEALTLIETGADTGIFTGFLKTVDRAVSDGADTGLLSAKYNNQVLTTFVDRIRADGSLNTSLEARTLITNDSILINVQITAADGSISVSPLSSHGVSILEFDAAGNLSGNVFSYTTTAAGFIPSSFISMMKDDCNYSVLVKGAYNGIPYSQSEFFSLVALENLPVDSNGVRTLVVVIDPSGFVYDALTGERIAGADVALRRADGTPAAGPFSFYTHAPAARQSNPQQSGAAGYPGGFEFIGNSAGSDIQPGEYYVTVSFESTPALGATYAPVVKSSSKWAGRHEAYTGQVFRITAPNQPVGMKIPLMQAAFAQPLYVTKKADRETASVGDILVFAITVRNLSNSNIGPDFPVMIEDALPVGMTYIDGSAVNAAGEKLAVSENGNNLEFLFGRLFAAGDSRGRDSATIYYQAVVDTSAGVGQYLSNTAIALINKLVMSNEAVATVRVAPDPVMDMAMLLGKVFEDTNGNGRQDRNELGVPGVGVVLDDGTYVITDRDGLFSVAGAAPGMEFSGHRAVKIDVATLPDGVALTTPSTQLTKLLPGGMDRANFGVRFPEGAAKRGLVEGLEDVDRSRGNLFVGLLDAAAGELKSGAGEANRPRRDLYTEGAFAQGRAAFFFDGATHFISDWRMTAAYDSNKSNSFDMMTNRDRSQYLPTYGDQSKTYNLAGSRGRLFLKARNDNADISLGDYEATFDGVELAAVRRSLTGAKIDLKSNGQDPDADPKNRLTLFSSKGKQLHARSEFRSVGGTHYYLPHSNISAGSERITVETRSALAPDRVASRRVLRRGSDYDMDYSSGRIRLLSPVSISGENDLLNRDGVQSGDPVWIVAEYIYSPLSNDFGTAGARWRHTAYKRAGFGFSFLQENSSGDDHTLAGADFHLKDIGILESLSLEYARSKAGNAGWFASLDGGRSFTNTGALNSRRGAAARGDLKLKLFGAVDCDSYAYEVDNGFVGQSFAERGIRRGGISLSLEQKKKKWLVDYTQATNVGGGAVAVLNTFGGKTRALRAMGKRIFKSSALTAEYLRTYNIRKNPALNLSGKDTDGLAVLYEKFMSERINLYVRQQIALAGGHNYQSTLGVNYKMTERDAFTAEATLGSYGRGGRLGFERNKESGARYYASMSSGYSTESGENCSGAKAGMSGPISKKTEAFTEYGTESGKTESLVSKSVGVNHKYYAGGNWDVTLSAERVHEMSSLRGEYFTNAATVISDFAKPEEGERLLAEAGYRHSSGTRAAVQMNYRLQGETKIGQDISAFSEFEYITSELVNTDVTETKYTKSIFGAAYRPKDNDRLNLIAKVGRVHERRALAANTFTSPETVSNVMSIEGLFNLTDSLTVKQKLASKIIKQDAMGMPSAKSRTTLWIAGLNWKRENWDIDIQYRTRHQPTALNQSAGVAIDAGYTFKKKIRVSAGYNFSSFTDDEFASESYSYRGAMFGLQMMQ